MLGIDFYDRPPPEVARDLVGKVLRRRHGELWLSAAIVEAEAYGADQGNHASLGRTPSREAMWAQPGTIYMYISRGGDSLNVSVQGEGSVVLLKSARPWLDDQSSHSALAAMHKLSPGPRGQRADHKLLAGQSLLARALDLRAQDWNGRQFDRETFYIEDAGYQPASIVKTLRLGIPEARQENLLLRYVDETHVRSATQNPLGKRNWIEGQEYQRLSQG